MAHILAAVLLVCIVSLTPQASAAAAPSEDAFVRVYDPWQDKWDNSLIVDRELVLPPFMRSIVVRSNAPI